MRAAPRPIVGCCARSPMSRGTARLSKVTDPASGASIGFHSRGKAAPASPLGLVCSGTDRFLTPRREVHAGDGASHGTAS